MPNINTSTASNVLFLARYKAAKTEDVLGSRESAADVLKIDRGRMYRIEKGIANPYPEEIESMATLYDAPELRKWYCRECCPLGKDAPVVTDQGIDRLTVRALSLLRKMDGIKSMLLDIMDDGVVSEEEKPELQQIVAALDELTEVNENLKIWMQKNLR